MTKRRSARALLAAGVFFSMIVACTADVDAQYAPQSTAMSPIGSASIPTPIAPADGASNLPLDADSNSFALRLAWTEVAPVSTPLTGGTQNPDFEVQVGTDSTFQSGLAVDTVYPPINSALLPTMIGDSSDWVRGLKPSTSYFWRVRVVVEGHGYLWSSKSAFSTGAVIREAARIEIASPASGYEFPIEFHLNEPAPARIDTLMWHSIPVRMNTDGSRDTARYVYIFGTDSAKVATADTSLSRTIATDTIAGVSASPFKTYYWRVQAYYVTEPVYYPQGTRISVGRTGWSEVRSFSNQFQHVSIEQIQYVDSLSLNACDTEQSSHNAGLQGSALTGQGTTITVRCLVPPSVFNSTTLTMVVCDTGSSSGAWRSVMVQPFPPYSGQYVFLGFTNADYQAMVKGFQSVHQGDIMTLRGIVAEVPDTSLMTNTVFQCLSLSRLGADAMPETGSPVLVSDFYSGGKVQFSTAEQWEGCIVQMENLTVQSVIDSSKGTFNVADSAGNVMSMTDESTWFTFSSRRNPASSYTIPRPGLHVASIRGVVITEGGAYRIAPVLPGDIVMGPPAPHKITAYVFWDDNGDGVQDSGEIAASRFPITLLGKAYGNFTTDSTGRLVIDGLDPGNYSVTYGDIDPLWSLTTQTGTFPADFAAAPDSVFVSFGFHRNWDDITGAVYYDLNEDFTREPGEPGVGGWKVTVRGLTIDTAVVNPSGNYVLTHVSLGPDTLGIIPPPGWEVIYPEYYFQFIVIPRVVGFYYPATGFAVHPIPKRSKIILSVHDNSNERTLKLAWGNRGGASYGIAGTDPDATTFDYSEGELELPPAEFVIQNGYFDVRFLDPRGVSAQFGNGSWVDMRDFTSPTQVDTHLVAFYPGYATGGNYPVTLVWDKAQVAAGYTGQAIMVDTLGNVTDMKQVDSLVVSDRRVTSMLIITEGPNLPASSRLSWRMVSVPSTPLVTSISDLFSLPQSGLFSFRKPGGYASAASLLPGVGYWLKFVSPVGIPSVLASPATFPETLSVSEGWNLVGGPGVAISSGAVSSSPPGIIASMFTFSGGYSLADSLRPFEGYWVNASGSGSIIFGTGAAKQSATEPARAILARSTGIDFFDAEGVKRTVHLFSPETGDTRLPAASAFDLPPAPPQPTPDVRFASGRFLEYAAAGVTTEYTIAIGGAESFPVTISAPTPSHSSAFDLSVKMGNKYLSLGENSTVTLSSPVKSITVRVTAQGNAAIPREFALRQNYPNPFNPTTTLKYELPMASNVRLDVYDILGRLVKTLSQGEEAAGYKQVAWNAANVGSGTYFCRIEATGISDPSKHFSKAMKMVVVR